MMMRQILRFPRMSRPPILPLTSSRVSVLLPEIRTRTVISGALCISPFRTIHTTPAIRVSSSSPSSSPSHRHSLVDANAKNVEHHARRSVQERFKALVKAYGWYAVGVYLTVSVLDFAVAFAGVHLLGADYVSSVVASAKAWLHGLRSAQSPEPGRDGEVEVEEASKGAAAVAGGGQEGLYAMLVLAFTVHKALFWPVRIGVTAALRLDL
ncbi:hypothetical protein BJV74DRAFT_61471 [Russula compacta]|nr:hypothetical protein BJV74DRAFT_61471 [Russula compacta]